VKKISFNIAGYEATSIFYQNSSKGAKVGGFLAAAETLLIRFWSK
jgi:hypothetical protein